MAGAPTVLVFDSGLGGLTVHREVAKMRPDACLVYVADDAFFPYGRHPEEALVARVLSVIEAQIVERIEARAAPAARWSVNTRA